MARKATPLTDAVIRNAKPMERPRKLFDGSGLYLEITPSGGKLWRFKYQFAGKEKLLALGRWPETSLSAARRKREEARDLLARGIDPGKARKAEKLLQKALAENTPVPELTAPEILQAVSQVIRAIANGLVESGALPSVSHCNQRKEKEMIGSNLNEPGCSAADGRTVIVREDGTEEGGGNNEA
jgi:hypothetical protein